MNQELFLKRFKVPKEAYPVIDQIVTPKEQKVVALLETEEFTKEHVQDILSVLEKTHISLSEAEAFLEKGYRRGIFKLMKKENTYGCSDFYGRLDIFVISENDTYKEFAREMQLALDQWYFQEFYDGLNQDHKKHPTQDKVLPMDQVIALIQNDSRQLYLAPCDCRSLAGLCEKPLLTCLSYRDGINTFAHRGHSSPITKEEAIQVILDAERSGLMHTVNPGGICNCCGDCCYLFRARKKRDSGAFWPKSSYIVDILTDQCIGCGKCEKRCHLGVFTKTGRAITVKRENCVGCGICVSSCPTHALQLNESGRN